MNTYSHRQTKSAFTTVLAVVPAAASVFAGTVAMFAFVV